MIFFSKVVVVLSRNLLEKPLQQEEATFARKGTNLTKISLTQLFSRPDSTSNHHFTINVHQKTRSVRQKKLLTEKTKTKKHEMEQKAKKSEKDKVAA